MGTAFLLTSLVVVATPGIGVLCTLAVLGRPFVALAGRLALAGR